ncbi:MAG: hypothetical protein IKB16_08905 [Lentisphaeria bacterium]|nr:hypothetical protein [Lentisphaeria bacterium]
MSIDKFVDISRENGHYFANRDGSTYLPIGLNLCFYRNSENVPEETVLETYRRWFTNFAANGGNFVRIWLGVPFFDIMPDKLGEFSEKNLSHIRFIIELAEKLNIKLKFTFEHFRRVEEAGRDAELFPGAANFNKPIYAGIASNIREYLKSPECREYYLLKARKMAEAGFGDSPAVIAWELWNEINCIGGIDIIREWSDFMIAELKKIFPKQMILQNLGSFSGPMGYLWYDYLASVKDNAFMQAHRYLDPAGHLDICHGPLDISSADAIRELRDRRQNVPAILAEVGATEANHSSASHYYALDSRGTLLHDALFAPFFAGSAGCGQFWHWDYMYIERHDLYWHFKRFANALEGVDPVKEDFKPFHTASRRLRIYGLRGKSMILLWCRDKENTYEKELDRCQPPQSVTGEIVNSEDAKECICYFPWEDTHATAKIDHGWAILPEFKRSLVVKLLK